MPMPSHRPISASSSRASGSPSRAASVTSGPVRSSGRPADPVEQVGDDRAAGRHQRRGPRAPARCPRRTAPSSRGCRTRSGCRRAPPACGRTPPRCRSRPRMTRPPSTMPPPMPVPRLTMTRWLSPRPAPKRCSAQTAALASLSTKIGRGTRWPSASRSGSLRHDRCGAKTTVARSAATKPAAPMPTAAISSLRAVEQLVDDRDDGVLDDARARRAVRGVAAGPARARFRRRRRPHRPPWCRRCRCRWRAGPSATGCLLRVVGVTDRDRVLGAGSPAVGPWPGGSPRAVGVAWPVGGGRSGVAPRGCPRGRRARVAASAGQVGEAGQGLGAQRARRPPHRGTAGTTCRTGRGRARPGTGGRRSPRRRPGVRRPARRRSVARARRRPASAAAARRRPAARLPRADRRRLSRSRVASSATDPTCSSQRSAPTGPLLLVALEAHPQLAAADGRTAGRCTGAAPTAG